jgi:hypothetical protein
MCEKNLKKQNFGYKYKSLLTEIPYINCVPCTLHVRLRIFGVLLNLFLISLCKHDGFEGKGKIDDKHCY